MKVVDVMTRDVKTVTPGAPLKNAAGLLVQCGISGLPVVEDGKVVGVISEADVILKECGEAPRRGGLLGLIVDPPEWLRRDVRTVGQAMSQPALTIAPDRPVSEAATLMIERNVNRLPVVDAEGSLVGIVTRADLVRAFVRSDDEISREIRDDVILHTLWIAPEGIVVEVENGEVRLAGQVESKAEAEMLEHFVRRVPGVVSIDSQLSWLEDERKGRVPRAHALR